MEETEPTPEDTPEEARSLGTLHHTHDVNVNLRIDLHVHDQQGMAQVLDLLGQLIEGETIIMAAQDDIDAAIATLGADTQAIEDSVTRIQAEIATLQASGADTSGLVAALDSLNTAVGDVGNIVPVPPTT